MTNVLVVDDEESIRFSFERILSDAGYCVFAAEKETDVWEILGSHDVDVAVVDRILGNGGNGIDLVEKIGQRAPFCETILISGYPTFESAAETLKLGVFAYLTKPLKRSQICEKVLAATEKSRKKRDSDRHEKIRKSLFDQTPHAILITDLFHSVRFVNPAFSRIFGYDEEKIRGTRVSIVPEWDRMETGAEIESLLAGQTVPERKTKRRDAGGRLKDVAVSASLVRNGGGDACDILFIIRDLKEIKTFEKQLQTAQKMENLGFLTSGVAHNFGNTLYVIRSYAEMALQEPSAVGPFEKHFREIHKASNHALELIEQLRTFSRYTESNLVEASIRLIIMEMVRMLNPILPKNIELRVDLEPECPKIMADPCLIRQMFMNLCINARDAINGKQGILVVSLGSDEKRMAMKKGGTDKPCRCVRLTVSDNGCGMSPETVERIFEPLFSTKKEGTGLGLSMVRSIVESHGGRIEVESSTGQGSTFHIWFPVMGKGDAE